MKHPVQSDLWIFKGLFYCMSSSLVSFPSVSVSFLFLSCQSDVLPAYVTKLLSFHAQFGPKDEGSQLLKT